VGGRQLFYTIGFGVSVREPGKLKETVGTLGFLLLFAGSMLDIAGSTFVTQGGTPPATYFRVGLMEVFGSLLFLIGIYLIIKTR
jgi:hypothetical protein